MSYEDIIIKQCEEKCQSASQEHESGAGILAYVIEYLCKLWKQPDRINEWNY